MQYGIGPAASYLTELSADHLLPNIGLYSHYAKVIRYYIATLQLVP